MDFLKKLKLPDYLSLASLFFAWLSISFILIHNPHLAIFTMLAALFFDYLDGSAARLLKLDSKRGRYLDSFVDLVSYIVFSSLFYIKFLAPGFWVGIFVGYSMLALGILRLLRYGEEGILIDEKGKYYRGVTVLHISFLITLGYFLRETNVYYNGWAFSIIVFIASLLMLSNYKTHKKFVKFYWLIMVLVVLYTTYLRYGN